MKYKTKDEVYKRGRAAIGIPLGDIDKTGRIITGKGAIGTVIEESWFEYKPDSKAEPDFPEAGVELKVTPYLRTANGVRAKERLVCNLINYMKEYNVTFEESSFWKKCNTIFIMAYEYRKNLSKREYTIDEVYMLELMGEDYEIIKRDWEVIRAKIDAGNAHLISEGDTMYLGACTKGVSANSTRKQPKSDIRAKQRAYALKQSYMTKILNTSLFGQSGDERLVKDNNALKEKSFEQYVIERIQPFVGMTKEELIDFFKIETRAKNINEILFARIFCLKGKLSSTSEFQKAGIVVKTIQVNIHGSINENMSLPPFDFIQLSKEKWYSSTLYNYLAPAKFLFVIFKETENKKYIFERIKFWNIPFDDLEEVRRVWERTVNIIKQGVEIEMVGKITKTNLPKSSESYVAHVRPHATNKCDTLPLPDGRKMTKQSFWLNKKYIEKQIGLRTSE